MSLRLPYALMAALIAVGAVIWLTLTGWSGLRQEQEREASERALITAEVVRESFLSYAHSNSTGSPFTSLINGLEHTRAGGILSVGLANSSGSRMIIPNSPVPERLSSGLDALKVSLPLVNANECRACHVSEKDVLGVLDVSIASNGASDRGLRARRAVLMAGIWSALIALLALGLAAYAMMLRDEDKSQAMPKTGKWPEKGPVAPPSMESLQTLEKMATVSELASVIAHEIKNPLAGISGAVQVLAEGFPEHDQRKEIMREVLGEVERLDKAVRNLLSFAKPPEPSLVIVPFDEVVERSVKLVKGKAKKQGIDVNIVPAVEGGMVQADPDQLQQALLNVLINALHSMPGGGRLTVRTIMRPAEAELSISDTGTGIPSASIGKVFEPFYTTKTAGTGLGLSITKNIIERHGGRIRVESAPGAGTSVFITLPLADGNAG